MPGHDWDTTEVVDEVDFVQVLVLVKKRTFGILGATPASRAVQVCTLDELEQDASTAGENGTHTETS